uniref:MYND-type domain-containing protein n=1 Tax=Mycena chlorophos TaxID=658473 RepID=A0ABQ0L9U2_MYCCL|nr:predicted protein [Mycena chlorophos]
MAAPQTPAGGSRRECPPGVDPNAPDSADWIDLHSGPLSICSHCGRLRSAHHALKICGGCTRFAYCDKQCQRSHWVIEHSMDCRSDCVALRSPAIDPHTILLLTWRGIYQPSLMTFALFKASLERQDEDFLEKHMYVPNMPMPTSVFLTEDRFMLVLKKKDGEITRRNLKKAFQVVQDGFVHERDLAEFYEMESLDDHWLGSLPKGHTRIRFMLVMQFGPEPEDQRVSVFDADYTNLMGPLWRYNVQSKPLTVPLVFAYREYFRYSIEEDTLHLRLLIFIRLLVECKVVAKITNTLLNKMSPKLRAIGQVDPRTGAYSAMEIEQVAREVLRRSRARKEKVKALHSAIAQQAGCVLLEWPKVKSKKPFEELLASIIPHSYKRL